MLIKYLGPEIDFLRHAFGANVFGGPLPAISNTRAGGFKLTIDTVHNPQVVTNFKGNDLIYDSQGRPISGTIDKIIFTQSGNTVARMTGFNWDADAVFAAGLGYYAGDASGLETLLGMQDITFNARQSSLNPSVFVGASTELMFVDFSSEITAYGSIHKDHLTGGSAGDFLVGGKGDDTLRGLAGADRLNGGKGNDTLAGGAGEDVLLGGAGRDAIFGADGVDRILGGRGDDTIYTGSGGYYYSDPNDPGTLQGKVSGGAGDDSIYGSNDNDMLFGDAGIDTILGAGGADIIFGGGGDDDLDGDDGNDVLEGGLGGDNLDGGAGEDILIGGLGRDYMTGGAGDDIFVFNSTADSRKGNNADRIEDFQSGEDRLDFSDILPSSLSFIGGDGFSGSPEIRAYVYVGQTYVQLDTDGDLSSDMLIIIDGAHDLSAADFIL